MAKAKKSNRHRHPKKSVSNAKSNNLKTDGKKGIKPLDTEASSSTISKRRNNIPKTVFKYKYDTFAPITVNRLARARLARLERLEAMKKNSSEDDKNSFEDDSGFEDNHDHNLCVAEQFNFGPDSPIP